MWPTPIEALPDTPQKPSMSLSATHIIALICLMTADPNQLTTCLVVSVQQCNDHEWTQQCNMSHWTHTLSAPY